MLVKFMCIGTHAGAIATQGFFATSQLNWPFHITDINCTGSERTVWDCSHNALVTCRQSQKASVRCQGIQNLL